MWTSHPLVRGRYEPEEWFMARYRGRHRKPTHTGRNLAAISTSGAFLAAGLTITAGQAAAAPAGVLDAIEQCESGGDPTAQNPTSSASGAFQFLDSTWRSVTGLSGSAKDYPYATQREAAEKLLAQQGTTPWNASKSCWQGRAAEQAPTRQSEPAPQTRRAATPAPAERPAPQRQADPPNLGQRAADGSGQYRCADDKLHFEACDPHNVGEIVAFPLFTHAETAQPAPAAAPVATGRHAKPDPAPAPATTVGKPDVSGQVEAPAGGNTVTDAAKQLLGAPYVWGGTTASGVDCSGLVYNALQSAGHNPPRTAAAMQDWAAPISQSEAAAGDLFFWNPGGGGGTATHTGIYLGDNTVIEVSQPGTVVSIRSTYSGMTFGRIP